MQFIIVYLILSILTPTNQNPCEKFINFKFVTTKNADTCYQHTLYPKCDSTSGDIFYVSTANFCKEESKSCYKISPYIPDEKNEVNFRKTKNTICLTKDEYINFIDETEITQIEYPCDNDSPEGSSCKIVNGFGASVMSFMSNKAKEASVLPGMCWKHNCQRSCQRGVCSDSSHSCVRYVFNPDSLAIIDEDFKKAYYVHNENGDSNQNVSFNLCVKEALSLNENMFVDPNGQVLAQNCAEAEDGFGCFNGEEVGLGVCFRGVCFKDNSDFFSDKGSCECKNTCYKIILGESEKYVCGSGLDPEDGVIEPIGRLIRI